MKKLLIAAFLLAAVPFSSFGWNKLGHDISAAIAQQNMTKKAKKNIAKYLEGHDIIYYASWMDYLGYVTKAATRTNGSTIAFRSTRISNMRKATSQAMR